MHERRGSWGFVNFLLFIVTILGGWWVFTHHQDIIDWWRLSNYQPSARVVQIADQTSMTPRARNVFYISDPQIEDREAFNTHCKTTAEHGKVLGCYAMQQIFLFNVSDARLSGVVEVTAAHETLHAVYERLDASTKEKVDMWVRNQAEAFKNDKKLQDLLAIYSKTEPDQLDNELHSILATEYGTLSPELEAHYKNYFTDRSKVVAYQKAYNAEFDASKARIGAHQARLASLKRQIDANTSELEHQSNELTSESARMDNLRHSDPAAYNQQVPGFNAKVQEYNKVARTTQSLVDEYNGIVAKIKNEIALQNDLNHSLDSKYKPVQTQ